MLRPLAAKLSKTGTGMGTETGMNRACEECKWKKTKCDSRRPQCTRCTRVGAICIYPLRKSRLRNCARRKSRSQNELSQDSTIDSQRRLDMEVHQQISLNSKLSPLRDTFMEGGDMNLEFDHSIWENTTDNFQFLQNQPGSSITTRMGEGVPTSPSMIDCIVEMLPARRQNECYPQIEYVASSMISLTRGPSDIPETPRSLGACAVLDDYPIKRISLPAETIHSAMHSADVCESPQRYSINVPTCVVDELIDCYFKRVQVFLPLFHQPTFHKTHVHGDGEHRYTSLKKESAFILYGMMALSARFSTVTYFNATHLKERGIPFAHQAQELYNQAAQEAQVPSLIWLQGCILLAYYNQSCRPSKRCDLLVSACTRFAYDLELYKIDEDEANATDSSPGSVEQWTRKEEQRRAWWSTWELDTFDSVATRRPFMIDRNRIFVLLPVSDENWYQGIPLKSVQIHPGFLQCWKVLQDSQNQDERAWFLLSNYIAVQATELCQRRNVPRKSVNDVETVVTCFSLLFYDKFQKKKLKFDENTYAKSNWIILTRLMIQSARVTSCILNSRISHDPIPTVANSFVDESSTTVPKIVDTSIDNYYQPVSEAFRTYQLWSPEYIAFAPPTMVCLIPGPEAVVYRYARHLRKEQSVDGDLSHPSIQEELMILIINNFAQYWNIGSSCSISCELSTSERNYEVLLTSA